MVRFLSCILGVTVSHKRDWVTFLKDSYFWKFALIATGGRDFGEEEGTRTEVRRHCCVPEKSGRLDWWYLGAERLCSLII